MPYAHSRNDEGNRQDLVEHLRRVANLAAGFGAAFGAAEAARALGLCHDLGKFHPAFQRYLLDSEAGVPGTRRGPDHKAAGAKLIAETMGLPGLLVQAHHGGLRSPGDFRAWLGEYKGKPETAEALDLARSALSDLAGIDRASLPEPAASDPLAADLLLRLLFSALVDADFLDTENHLARDRATRRGSSLTLPDLWARFERDQAAFAGRDSNPVNEVRRDVYAACLAAAETPPGLFRLSVPTGGGKTRSGMAFALRHAIRHGLRRVIVAIPYTSITEQTADVYRAIFGLDDRGISPVLEHHSAAVDPQGEASEYIPGYAAARLAAENWDLPVVVTTTVQLFESLFATATSKARKIHRLAGSVILVDEAQALPLPLLTPILDALRRLCRDHGATVVLSTATQPAFDAVPALAALPAREIVPNPGRLFAAVKRVEYDWQTQAPLPWEVVAGRMAEARQALAIVNTKNDALALLDALGDPAALHLSTLLCGAHRREVIAEVKRRLAAGEPCHLISTQVVEAGVDLDFPLVLRALGPLDSIVQAAGRCNREGNLAVGTVVVFRPAGGGMPRGAYGAAAELALAMLADSGGDLDLHDPATVRAYFARLYATLGRGGLDREGIQGLRKSFDFPEVAKRFRMIDDDTASVVVRFGDENEQQAVGTALDDLSRGGAAARYTLRALQPRIVNLRRRLAEGYARQGWIRPILPGLGEWLGDYDPVRGLAPGDPDPEALVV